MSVRSLAMRPVALGLTLLAITGGNAAYEAAAKSVTITIDGERRTMSTHRGNVGEVLQQAGVAVGSHDLLAPALGTDVKDGSAVVIRRGRELSLVVDGAQRTVWVTALSVDEALSQLNLRDPGSLLSADRSRAIPLKGFSLDIRTRKDVQVLDGGKVRRASTNALRVKDVLTEMHVLLRKGDRMSVTPATQVRDGLVIRVTRVDGKKVSEDFPIAFGVERRNDSSMFKSTSKVVRPGRVGVLHKTYALTFVNRKLTARKLISSTRTALPVTKIIAVGTKARPVPKPAPRQSVGSTGGLNWAALARCESGGNPRAVSSGGTYRGLYQFSLSTWRGVGGSGDPIDASSSEQTYRAQILYSRSGRSPWPHCGQYL